MDGACYPILSTPTAPYDRYTARRGDGTGGVDARGHGREIIPGLVDGVIRESTGAYSRDKLILRDRMPTYMRDYMTGNANTLVDWTNCGYIRPSLRMRQATVRRQVGTDATRNFDPHPIVGFGTQDQGHGMHTNVAPYKRAANARHFGIPQMMPANVNRLTSARYSGQSYSQTTTVYGGGR
jgi:hypothetical protein